MAQRSFVDVEAGPVASVINSVNNGPALVGLIGGEYARELNKRCQWVASVLGDLDDQALERLFGVRGSLWGAEFVGTESVGDSA